MLLNPSIVTGGVPPRFARAGSNEPAVTWVASDREWNFEPATSSPKSPEPSRCSASPRRFRVLMGTSP